MNNIDTKDIDNIKESFIKVLQKITDNFYSDNSNVTLKLSNKGLGDNYYDQKELVLSSQLMDVYRQLGLPMFLIYYHELGHHLYTKGLFELMDKWQRLKTGPLLWKKSYHHLLNWIEDFFIESKIVVEYSYTTDIMNCIKKLPPDYDITRIEYAFNYYYIHGAPTPALLYNDQLVFKNYINQLIQLRHYPRFGQGVISNLMIKQTADTKFAMLIIEFYEWCVNKSIFPKDKELPKLSSPTNHLELSDGSSNNPNINTSPSPSHSSSDSNTDPDPDNNIIKEGSSSEHSHKVGGSNITYEEVTHVKTPTTVFKEELIQENKLIQKELLDMSQRIDSKNITIDGLFSTRYKESSMIQPRAIIPNFFNPNRIADQILFAEKQHTYMNVAIYRDISGSTTGDIHKLMSYVCEQLYKDIPVDITYYLYASGDISIIEVPYILWENSNKRPDIYIENPLFKQLKGGTNSGAIADAITQQLSDKWLNIIITDGDLNNLMARDNIMGLLKNVFVIAVGAEVEEGLLGIHISNEEDIKNINSVLSTINLSR